MAPKKRKGRDPPVTEGHVTRGRARVTEAPHPTEGRTASPEGSTTTRGQRPVREGAVTSAPAVEPVQGGTSGPTAIPAPDTTGRVLGMPPTQTLSREATIPAGTGPRPITFVPGSTPAPATPSAPPAADLTAVLAQLLQQQQSMQREQADMRAFMAQMMGRLDTPAPLPLGPMTTPIVPVPEIPQTPALQGFTLVPTVPEAARPTSDPVYPGYHAVPPPQGYRYQELDPSRAMERFMKLRPPAFTGILSEPLAPARWVKEMEKAFALSMVGEAQKIDLVTYLLKDRADAWWTATRPMFMTQHPTPSWEDFKREFFRNYFPESFRDRKLADLRALKQERRSVVDYQAEFEDLYYFAPSQDMTDAAKAKAFRKGLRPEIYVIVTSHVGLSYPQVVSMAKDIEEGQTLTSARDSGKKPTPVTDTRAPLRFYRPQLPSSQTPQRFVYTPVSQPPVPAAAAQTAVTPAGSSGSTVAPPTTTVCFSCKQPGHWSRQCPQKGATSTQSSARTQQLRTYSAVRPAAPTSESRVQGRVFALTAYDAAATPGVLTGIFSYRALSINVLH